MSMNNSPLSDSKLVVKLILLSQKEFKEIDENNLVYFMNDFNYFEVMNIEKSTKVGVKKKASNCNSPIESTKKRN